MKSEIGRLIQILDHAAPIPRPDLPTVCTVRMVEVGPAFRMGKREGEGYLSPDDITGQRGFLIRLTDGGGEIEPTRGQGPEYVSFGRMRLVCPRTCKVFPSVNDLEFAH